jgi:hypothetical protein
MSERNCGRWRPRPEVRTGRFGESGSLGVGLAAAGPDEVVAFSILVVEEVGVNRRAKARIVQLDQEIVSALVGALRPGGSDLHTFGIDPMAGGVVVCPVGLGDDADTLRGLPRGVESPGEESPTADVTA